MQDQQINVPTSVHEEGKAVALAPWLIIHGICPVAKPEKGKGEHADGEITGRITQLIASAVLCSEYHVKWAYECLEDSF